jgi:hypothetical protein
MLKINKEPEEAQKNHYADLNYLSDDSYLDGPSVEQQAGEWNHRYLSSRDGTYMPRNNRLN